MFSCYPKYHPVSMWQHDWWACVIWWQSCQQLSLALLCDWQHRVVIGAEGAPFPSWCLISMWGFVELWEASSTPRAVCLRTALQSTVSLKKGSRRTDTFDTPLMSNHPDSFLHLCLSLSILLWCSIWVMVIMVDALPQPCYPNYVLKFNDPLLCFL